MTKSSAWLLLNAWKRIPEEPAPLFTWITEEEAVLLRRAHGIKSMIEDELRSGNDVLGTYHEKKGCRDGWRNMIAYVDKAVSGPEGRGLESSAECAVMGTYVDDCELDADKKSRKVVWK